MAIDNDVTEIECKCSDNPDLCGYWKVQDVKDECREVGIPEKDWYEYLFGHLFVDYDGWNADIEKVFMSSNVISLKLMIGFYEVTLTKGYN